MGGCLLGDVKIKAFIYTIYDKYGNPIITNTDNGNEGTIKFVNTCEYTYNSDGDKPIRHCEDGNGLTILHMISCCSPKKHIGLFLRQSTHNILSCGYSIFFNIFK